jgi:[acyl-carrier-protein] S-malonyltransferase
VEVGPVATLGPLIRQVHPDLPLHLATAPGALTPIALPEPELTGPAPTGGER